MAKPLWTMNIHFKKKKGRDAKQVLFGVGTSGRGR
jgi:hypothetical protein